MSNFKGTKGKSSVTNNVDISTDNFGLIATTFCGGSGLFKKISVKEQIANAELIADAFNTINNCNLFPSELLAQRDETLEILKEAIELLYGTTEFEVIEKYRRKVNEFEQLLTKITE